jgi:DNA (cytosine-5)-methyltransferase 1
LSAEPNQRAREILERLFGEKPHPDLASDSFRQTLAETPHDVLLASLPCQPLRASPLALGRGAGKQRKTFFLLADYLAMTRPAAFLFESSPLLVTRAHGRTFGTILDVLSTQMNYEIIGAVPSPDNKLTSDPASFILNSLDFGVPVNLPRAYVVGFDRQRFSPDRLGLLPPALPSQCHPKPVFRDDFDAKPEPRFRSSPDPLTAGPKRARVQRARRVAHDFGLISATGTERPVFPGPKAFVGSAPGQEPNGNPNEFVPYLPALGHASSPNVPDESAMDPDVLATLQGFKGHAFVSGDADGFSFPDNLSSSQRLKLLSNAGCVPVLEELAHFVSSCLSVLAGGSAIDP